MAKLIDITWARFTSLVVRRPGRRTMDRVQNVLLWECVCDCGNFVEVSGADLRSGHTKSCGCLRAGNPTHGMSKTSTYGIWRGVKNRCLNSNVKGFSNYGGRGIAICDRWNIGENGKSGFECFIEDVGERPSKKHSIERLDVNGHYAPGNVAWATLKEQANNRRCTRFIDYQGSRISLSEAIETSGCKIHYEIVAGRIARGWSVMDALMIEPASFSDAHKGKIRAAALSRNPTIATRQREA